MSFFLKKDFDAVKASGASSGLEKNLGSMDLILLGLGAIIGTGVFVLTGFVAAQHAGPAVTLSYAIAGATCIFVALAYTELATMLPTAGSIYTYSYVAFGEVFAWLMGSLIIIELGFASASVAAGWSGYVVGILESGGIYLPEMLTKVPSDGGIINLPACIIVIFVAFVLYLGTKDSKKLNNILVVIKMLAILIFIIFAAPSFDIKNWSNFMPFGFDEVLFGSSILFFAYTGFGILASAAEECRNPKRDLTIGIIGSLIAAIIAYVIIAALITGIVPYHELDNPQPLAYALKAIGSNIGSALVATGAICGFTTVLMMNIYGQSRIFYVIARDGLLPKSMAKLHPKYDSPYVTIFIFSGMIAILAAFCPYKILGQLSSMGALIDYLVISVIVLYFRIKLPNVERPFRCPAVLIVAPIAITASGYLLSKQIFSKNNDLLLTGKIMIIWFVIMFLLYVIRHFLVQKIAFEPNKG